MSHTEIVNYSFVHAVLPAGSRTTETENRRTPAEGAGRGSLASRTRAVERRSEGRSGSGGTRKGKAHTGIKTGRERETAELVTGAGARRGIPVSSDLCACHHGGGGGKVAGDGTNRLYTRRRRKTRMRLMIYMGATVYYRPDPICGYLVSFSRFFALPLHLTPTPLIRSRARSVPLDPIRFLFGTFFAPLSILTTSEQRIRVYILSCVAPLSTCLGIYCARIQVLTC